MTIRQLRVLAVLVVAANLVATYATVSAGMWGLLPANLTGVGLGLFVGFWRRPVKRDL